MLYQNEEPLVQRTCIKTANLQSDINTSDKLETQELPPEGVHLSKAEYADPDGGISAVDRR